MIAPPTTHKETVNFVKNLENVILSPSFSLTVSDLNTLLSLLRYIVNLATLLPLDEDTLGTLTLIIDLQASADVADMRQSIGEDYTGVLLAIFGKIGRLAAESVEGRIEIERDNIDLMVSREVEFEGIDYKVDSNGLQESSVSIPDLEDIVSMAGKKN